MSLGEILDRTFEIYRARFLVFAGIAALPALAMMAIELANAFWWRLHLEDAERIIFRFTIGDLISMLAFYQISLFLHILVWPSLAYVTSKSCFGEQATLSSAFLDCIDRWKGWLSIAVALWTAALLLPELLDFGLLAGIGYLRDALKLDSPTLDKSAPFITIIASWALMLALGAPLLLGIPAWTLERMSVRSALLRSWKLSRGRRSRIVFVRILSPVLGWFLNYVLVLLPFLLFAMLLRGVGGRWFFYRHLLGINFVAALAASSLAGPIFPIALTLFYYDQRIRREGYDIERMMEAAGLNPAVTLSSGDAPAASGAEELPA
jgi:hypothetical protein